MSHIFISYSKKDIEFARSLRGALQDKGFAVWMDETKLVPSERWWKTIEQNIVTCAAFIIVMSPNSAESDFVEREILTAEDEHKAIFPVLLAGKGWHRLANIQYEDMRTGLAMRPEFVDGLQRYVPTFTGRPVPPPLPTDLISATPTTPPRTGRRSTPLMIGLATALVVMVITVVLIAARPGGLLAPSNVTITPSSTVPSVAENSSHMPNPASVPSEALALTTSSTPDFAMLALTYDAGQTQTQAARSAQVIATESSVRTATATHWTPKFTPQITATFEAFLTQRAAVSSSTALYLPTPFDVTATGAVEVTRSTDTVSGYEFVVVPGGDFQDIGVRNSESFRIGRYPVSNAQFAAFLNSRLRPSSTRSVQDDEPLADFAAWDVQIIYDPNWHSKVGLEDQPMVQATWYGARDYCESISARLPTVTEWRIAGLLSLVQQNPNIPLRSSLFEWTSDVSSNMRLIVSSTWARSSGPQNLAEEQVTLRFSSGKLSFRCVHS